MVEFGAAAGVAARYGFKTPIRRTPIPPWGLPVLVSHMVNMYAFPYQRYGCAQRMAMRQRSKEVVKGSGRKVCGVVPARISSEPTVVGSNPTRAAPAGLPL